MAKFYYGGQAVVEGVMMRGRKTAAMAVRCPDNSIYIYEETLNPKLYQNRLFRLPFLRGMLLLWEMLVLGTRLMTLATNIATGAIDPATLSDMPAAHPPASSDEPGKEVPRPRSAFRRDLPPLPNEEERPPQIGGLALAITLVVSLGFAIAVFFLGPLLITGLFHRQIGEGWLNLTVEGIIRLALLVGYLYLIGR